MIPSVHQAEFLTGHSHGESANLGAQPGPYPEPTPVVSEPTCQRWRLWSRFNSKGRCLRPQPRLDKEDEWVGVGMANSLGEQPPGIEVRGPAVDEQNLRGSPGAPISHRNQSHDQFQLQFFRWRWQPQFSHCPERIKFYAEDADS